MCVIYLTMAAVIVSSSWWNLSTLPRLWTLRNVWCRISAVCFWPLSGTRYLSGTTYDSWQTPCHHLGLRCIRLCLRLIKIILYTKRNPIVGLRTNCSSKPYLRHILENKPRNFELFSILLRSSIFVKASSANFEQRGFCTEPTISTAFPRCVTCRVTSLSEPTVAKLAKLCACGNAV